MAGLITGGGGLTVVGSAEITNGSILNEDINAAAAIDATKLVDGTVSNTELQYINSLTSNAQTQLTTNATAISDHLADAADAHDASAISNVAAGNLAATDVQAALNELQTDVDTRATATSVSDHLGDAGDAHDASAISSVASGNLAATDVQAALNELQTDIDTRATATSVSDHLSDSSAAHAASAISSTTTGQIAATDVQAAIVELELEKQPRTYTTTATAAGTTTLTVASTFYQRFTGTSTQTVVLPVASTMTLGFGFKIINNSTGRIAVRASDAASDVVYMAGESTAFVFCILTSGTNETSWDYVYSLTAPVVTSVTTAAGTTTISAETSGRHFLFTGSTTQIAKLPNTTVGNGTSNYNYPGEVYHFMNRSTGAITINSNNSTLLTTLQAGQSVRVTLQEKVTGTGPTDWAVDFVNPMTTAGDIIYGGTSGVGTRLAAGSSGQFLKSAGAAAPVWASASQGDVQAKTTTYTALVTDGYINCSGSVFTVTLFAASGNAGKVLTITKTDSSLTNIITIDGNASETINGATTTTLNTQYESVTLYCDGSNWFILNRVIPKTWTSYTTNIIGSTTAGSMTYSAQTLYWAREGDRVIVQGNIRINVVTIAPIGNTYINLPSGITYATQASASDGGRGPWGTTVGNLSGVANLLNWVTITANGTGTVSVANGLGTQITFANADEVKVLFTIPATGWNG